MKHVVEGNVEKYMDRFLAKGFSQVEGVDCEEIFSPMPRYYSIKTILALTVHFGWKIYEMDVKTTFINGVVEEEIYIEYPEGF